MQNTEEIPVLSECQPAKHEYKKSSFSDIYEVLQFLREDEVFCDIKLQTDDGGFIFCHKVVLASASPYFLAMFTNFSEKNQDQVTISQLDSATLQLLIEFIYSGEILITDYNVQDLLPASNLLQLQEVKNACCDFLQAQLCPTNVIGIIELADLHSCTTLFTSSELYFHQHYSDVVEGKEFLSLSSEQIVKLISIDELTVPTEEKVFESVIRWVKHDLDSRKQILPQLMEHVRLPLTTKDYILKNVVDEPLLINCSKCKDYVIEALHFHLSKSDKLITIPHNIRTKPRLPGGTRHNFFLVVGGIRFGNEVLDSTEWYDPKLNQWQSGPKLIAPRSGGGLAVVKDNNIVLYVGGFNNVRTICQSVEVLDLSSELPSWKPTNDMIVPRQFLGVGVINNHVYAVGGYHGENALNRAEVFDCRTQQWRLISDMSTRRSGVGLGVLNNILFAITDSTIEVYQKIGGFDGISQQRLKSVECYHSSLDKWIPIAEMCVGRSSVGVGVLDGVLYAVGGHDGFNVHRSVEAYRPSTGVWTTVADMHLCRRDAGVAVLDGLLYVVGGTDGHSVLDSVECYNPNTNTWTMVTASMNAPRKFLGVVAIEIPQHFKTNWFS